MTTAPLLPLPQFVTLETVQHMYVEITRLGWRDGKFTKKTEKEIAELLVPTWTEADDAARFNMFMNIATAYYRMFHGDLEGDKHPN